ncbi:hypothetical protein [Azospirillum melinis]
MSGPEQGIGSGRAINPFRWPQRSIAAESGGNNVEGEP